MKVFGWGILFGILAGIVLAWLGTRLYYHLFGGRIRAQQEREIVQLRRKVADLERIIADRERIIEEKNRYIEEAVRAAVEDTRAARSARKGV